MKYLVMDTSGDRLLVLLKSGEFVKVSYLQNCLTKHSLTLLPEIENLLKTENASLSDLDFIGTVVGPGSFTGVRIGVATAKALCTALNKPALALTSFDVLSYTDKASEKLLCLIDARHDNYYAQAFNCGVKSEPAFISKSEIEKNYSDYKIISDIKIEGLDTVVADMPVCLTAAAEGESEKLISYQNIAPLYVKKSQAEEEATCV